MSTIPSPAALELAQENCAVEVAKFLQKYVNPANYDAALVDLTTIIDHYNTTLDLLPEPPMPA